MNQLSYQSLYDKLILASKNQFSGGFELMVQHIKRTKRELLAHFLVLKLDEILA
jgi:hypothetical protein